MATNFFPRFVVRRGTLAPGRIVSAVAVLLLFGAPVLVRAGVADDAALIEEIKSAWATQRAEVQSAKIRIRQVFRPSEAGATQATVEAAFLRVMEADGRGDNDVTRQAVEACVKALIGPRAPPVWGVQEIIVDGKSVRNTGIFQDEVHRESSFSEGVNVEFSRPSGFATVGAGPGNTRRYDASYVRFIPSIELPWTVVGAAPNGPIMLEFRSGDEVQRVTVDGRTKMATRFSAPGARERIRGAFAEFPGGVWAPTYGIDVSFGQGGVARNVGAFMVEHAEFNSLVDRSAFAVNVPKGTNVLDARVPSRLKTGRVKAAPSVDVVRFADQISRRGPSYFSPLRFAIFVVILFAGIALAAAGVKRLIVSSSSASR